jgi:hypothetical protein
MTSSIDFWAATVIPIGAIAGISYWITLAITLSLARSVATKAGVHIAVPRLLYAPDSLRAVRWLFSYKRSYLPSNLVYNLVWVTRLLFAVVVTIFFGLTAGLFSIWFG